VRTAYLRKGESVMGKSDIGKSRLFNWRGLGGVAKRTAGVFVLAALVMGTVHYLNRTLDRLLIADPFQPSVGAATVHSAPESPAPPATAQPAAAQEEIDRNEYYCTPHPC
jgi:hypothetical protein